MLGFTSGFAVAAVGGEVAASVCVAGIVAWMGDVRFGAAACESAAESHDSFVRRIGGRMATDRAAAFELVHRSALVPAVQVSVRCDVRDEQGALEAALSVDRPTSHAGRADSPIDSALPGISDGAGTNGGDTVDGMEVVYDA